MSSSTCSLLLQSASSPAAACRASFSCLSFVLPIQILSCWLPLNLFSAVLIPYSSSDDVSGRFPPPTLPGMPLRLPIRCIIITLSIDDDYVLRSGNGTNQVSIRARHYTNCGEEGLWETQAARGLTHWLWLCKRSGGGGSPELALNIIVFSEYSDYYLRMCPNPQRHTHICR